MDIMSAIQSCVKASNFLSVFYRWPENVEHKKLTPTGHRIIVGKAIKLVEAMIANGAMKDELDNALCYTKVAIDAFKYDLDYQRAAIDFSIKLYTNKYKNGRM